jgi:hypothetical protein
VALTIIGLIVTGVIEPEQNTIIEKGNPLRLVNAIDYKGQLCGSDSGVANKRYGYYLPDFTGKHKYLLSRPCLLDGVLLPCTLQLFVFVLVRQKLTIPNLFVNMINRTMQIIHSMATIWLHRKSACIKSKRRLISIAASLI